MFFVQPTSSILWDTLYLFSQQHSVQPNQIIPSSYILQSHMYLHKPILVQVVLLILSSTISVLYFFLKKEGKKHINNKLAFDVHGSFQDTSIYTRLYLFSHESNLFLVESFLEI